MSLLPFHADQRCQSEKARSEPFFAIEAFFDNLRPDKQLLPINQFSPVSHIDFNSIISTTVFVRDDSPGTERKLVTGSLAILAL
ncbi:hypothetical protein A6X21_04315 [Planctopirus hydrillae]|uniref:Uncharacterized protein n=1 Tax=Planctopirus hydrillae TaxID=1841610 RepID=A0A1C3ENU6_9PLAN|nr:hypothetical protein A6X21_04315 [Planctopirus hydrillae]